MMSIYNWDRGPTFWERKRKSYITTLVVVMSGFVTLLLAID
jgi:hypothetical protein